MRKFKVGQRVMTDSVGGEGTVIAVAEDDFDYPYIVAFDNGAEEAMFADEELVRV